MTALRRAFDAYPRAYWVLWLGTLVNRLGEFVVPLLGFYLTVHRQLDVAEVSLILSMLGRGRFVTDALSGTLTDQRGAWFTMMLALMGGAVMTLTLSFATSFPALLGVLGFSLGSVLYKPASSAAVADQLSCWQRTHAYSLLSWAINVGAVGAPVLDGWLAAFSYRLLFWLDAATMMAYAALLGVPYPKERREAPAVAGPTAPHRLLLRDLL